MLVAGCWLRLLATCFWSLASGCCWLFARGNIFFDRLMKIGVKLPRSDEL